MKIRVSGRAPNNVISLTPETEAEESQLAGIKRDLEETGADWFDRPSTPDSPWYVVARLEPDPRKKVGAS